MRNSKAGERGAGGRWETQEERRKKNERNLGKKKKKKKEIGTYSVWRACCWSGLGAELQAAEVVASSNPRSLWFAGKCRPPRSLLTLSPRCTEIWCLRQIKINPISLPRVSCDFEKYTIFPSFYTVHFLHSVKVLQFLYMYEKKLQKFGKYCIFSSFRLPLKFHGFMKSQEIEVLNYSLILGKLTHFVSFLVHKIQELHYIW